LLHLNGVRPCAPQRSCVTVAFIALRRKRLTPRRACRSESDRVLADYAQQAWSSAALRAMNRAQTQLAGSAEPNIAERRELGDQCSDLQEQKPCFVYSSTAPAFASCGMLDTHGFHAPFATHVGNRTRSTHAVSVLNAATRAGVGVNQLVEFAATPASFI
jgi:hypothetical protein